MDDLSVRNRDAIASATAGAAKKGNKAQNSSGMQFASMLVFGTDNMKNNMSMSADQSHNDDIYDGSGDRSYEASYRDDRDTDTSHRRDDEPVHARDDDRDYRRDDQPRESRNEDRPDDTSQHHRDDRAQDDRPQNDQNASRDDRQDGEQTSKETAGDDTSAQDQANSAGENASKSGDNTQDAAEQAASNTFAQGNAGAAQVAADPTIVALADPKKANSATTNTAQNAQSVQNIDANGSANKNLFSQNWQTGNSQQQSTNVNQQGAQGQQQAQNAQNNTQNVNPQQQAQITPEAQRQANDLSKKIGPNQQASVKVTVNDASAETTSQTTQNLSNATQVAASEGNKASTNAAKTQNGSQGANANMGQNVQGAAINGQGAQVQHNNNQNNQSQNFQSMVGDAKGAAGGAAKSATVQQPQGITSDTSQVTTQNTAQQTQQSQQAAQTKPDVQHKPSVHTTAKPEEISVEITKAAKAGADRINIQLKPLELGRIEVQLDMSSGKVMANVVVDRPETLQMLKNDSAGLEKALSDAGLNMGDMNFNLKNQDNANQQMGQSGNGGANGEANGADAEPEEEVLLASEMDLITQRLEERAAARGGVDVSA